MELRFDWQSPIKLTQNKKIIDKDEYINEIENKPGIYYFARDFGDKSEPFYIGETKNLRTRLKQHLETVRIADILRGMKVKDAPKISNGSRSFHFAYFKPKPGQNTEKSLKIAQRFMISEALASNLPLLNSQLTVIKTHKLIFSGNNNTRIFNSENSVAV